MLNSLLLASKIALAYFVGAQVGFQLSLMQNSPATLLWPPSGIALAAVLIHGNRALPGVLIGALMVNLLLMMEGPSWTGLGAAVAISLSSTLGAITAGVLLGNFARSAPIWTTAADLLRGSVAIGVACLIPAVLGPTSLYWAGQFSADSARLTIGIWWLGDYAGMIIFTPMAYAIARRLKGNFWRPTRPDDFAGPTALNCFIALLSLLVFLAIWNFEGHEISESLEREASLSAKYLTQSLHKAKRDLESISSLISTSEKHFDEDTFIRYTTSLLSDNEGAPGAYRVSWAPHVTNPRDWERQMHKAGRPPSLQMFEEDPQGHKIRVGKRDDYFPLQYIYSRDPMRKTLTGFDLGSESEWRKNIERVRSTWRVSMARPILLPLSASGGQLALQICAPVFMQPNKQMNARERRASFRGVTCGIYMINMMVEYALVSHQPDNDLHLFDKSGASGGGLLYSILSPGSDLGAATNLSPALDEFLTDFQGMEDVHFGGQTWVMVAKPGTVLVETMRSWMPWTAMILILTVGMVGSGIIIERVSAKKRVDEERRRTEAALNVARAASESKSYFMAAASHDIKQPLYALGILTDTLLMTGPPEATKHIIKSLKKSIAAMSQHFDTLMDLGRFQDGSFEATIAPFSLADLSRRITLEIGPMCREKGLRWVLEFDDAVIVTDPELLLRLIRNLLINAVRYTTAGEIKCTARVQGEDVEFVISDTGPGLSTEKQRLVFSEPDSYDDPNSVNPFGLGLSIVNKIRRALNLQIKVAAKRGAGTTFSFRVARAED